MSGGEGGVTAEGGVTRERGLVGTEAGTEQRAAGCDCSQTPTAEGEKKPPKTTKSSMFSA